MTATRIDIAERCIESGRTFAEVLGPGWELTSFEGGSNTSRLNSCRLYLQHVKDKYLIDDSLNIKLLLAEELTARLT